MEMEGTPYAQAVVRQWESIAMVSGARAELEIEMPELALKGIRSSVRDEVYGRGEGQRQHGTLPQYGLQDARLLQQVTATI